MCLEEKPYSWQQDIAGPTRFSLWSWLCKRNYMPDFMLSCFIRVWLFATLWTVAHKAPLAVGFSKQEYWSGLPSPPPGDLPNPGIQPRPLALPADSLPLSYQGSQIIQYIYFIYKLYTFDIELHISIYDLFFIVYIYITLKICIYYNMWASLIAQLVKNLPAVQETRFSSWVGKIHWRRDRYTPH